MAADLTISDDSGYAWLRIHACISSNGNEKRHPRQSMGGCRYLCLIFADWTTKHTYNGDFLVSPTSPIIVLNSSPINDSSVFYTKNTYFVQIANTTYLQAPAEIHRYKQRAWATYNEQILGPLIGPKLITVWGQELGNWHEIHPLRTCSRLGLMEIICTDMRHVIRWLLLVYCIRARPLFCWFNLGPSNQQCWSEYIKLLYFMIPFLSRYLFLKNLLNGKIPDFVPSP